ncbi:hypothetical protein EKQ61_06225 [Staphylococcus gallinarum]|uniref:AraC family transcriptional regulator n=1 Tax=Staphylococcus gallinarum TaxID=1293 RepID=A0A0D0SEK6_STAGA|nr:hypothetical protein [Staphylococcus gallinarum]KIR10640.1 hypothetical protein SH09_10750 [Staphylococcus gallinarum]RTX78704.1 hypothetical protein EKQ61_06225 [Staphylococcus gallinarum]GEQ04523.1 hypothetical protein SGA02_03510 [Staphylococcus gallinarum]SUM32071.1 Uncharacterised protein [Staphylococcus gallinarum]
MNIKDLKSIDVLLKKVCNELNSNHYYQIVCNYKGTFVTLDFVLPFLWNGEFYCSEPKTISSIRDDKEVIYMNIDSQYYSIKDGSIFKFKQFIKHFENKETNYLMLYLLENKQFYKFDNQFSDFVYNIESLDKSWKLPITKVDDDLEFISLQLVEPEQS